MTLVIEMKKIVIKENDANQRIDKYLKKLLCNAPSNFIYKMFRKKDIKINGKKVNEKYILQKDDILEMFLYDDKFNEFTKEKDIYDLKREFKVLYEDQNILIVDKPVGLLVHGDAKENVNTLSHQVLSYLKEKGELDVGRESTFTPGPVHRLDRNTSGIVIFGKTLAALQDLNEMMKKRHHIEKSYMTICKGKLTKQQELVGYVKKIDNEDRVRFVKKDDKDALMMKTIADAFNVKKFIFNKNGETAFWFSILLLSMVGYILFRLVVFGFEKIEEKLHLYILMRQKKKMNNFLYYLEEVILNYNIYYNLKKIENTDENS